MDNTIFDLRILAILAFTMCGAAVVAGILTNLEIKLTGSRILVASLGPAWMVASVTNAPWAKSFLDVFLGRQFEYIFFAQMF